jgi:hypothetical protein
MARLYDYGTQIRKHDGMGMITSFIIHYPEAKRTARKVPPEMDE